MNQETIDQSNSIFGGTPTTAKFDFSSFGSGKIKEDSKAKEANPFSQSLFDKSDAKGSDSLFNSTKSDFKFTFGNEKKAEESKKDKALKDTLISKFEDDDEDHQPFNIDQKAIDKQNSLFGTSKGDDLFGSSGADLKPFKFSGDLFAKKDKDGE